VVEQAPRNQQKFALQQREKSPETAGRKQTLGKNSSTGMKKLKKLNMIKGKKNTAKESLRATARGTFCKGKGW